MEVGERSSTIGDVQDLGFSASSGLFGTPRFSKEMCLPERREEDARATGQVSLLEEVGSEAPTRRTKRMDLVGTCSGLAAQEDEGRVG